MRDPTVGGIEVPRPKTARLLGELYGSCLRFAHIDLETIVNETLAQIIAVRIFVLGLQYISTHTFEI